MVTRCMAFIAASTVACCQTYYHYDDRGQLAKVVDSTGIVLEYVYDPVGNILEVRRSNVAPGTLSIYSFTPQKAAPGTILTIQGQGFSTTPAANIVRINGISATVTSATTTMLTVVVPVGAATGPVTVTVGASTATSASPLTYIPAPVISSLPRRYVVTGEVISGFAVTGINLVGSTFSFTPGFLPPAILVTAAAVVPIGLGATLSLNVGQSPGTFTLIATNPSAASEAFPTSANSLQVLRASTDEDRDDLSNSQEIALGTDPFDSDTDDDGYHDGMEAAAGSDARNAASTPETAFPHRESASPVFSVLNSSVPADPTAPFRETVSFLVSMRNTAVPVDPTAEIRESVGLLLSMYNAPNEPVRETVGTLFSIHHTLPPPSPQMSEAVRLHNPDAPALRIDALPSMTHFEGETVRLSVDAANVVGLAQVELSSQGVNLAVVSRPPFEFVFTIPAGQDSIALELTAADHDGRRSSPVRIPIRVIAPVGLERSAAVVEEEMKPVRNQKGRILIQGLVAEYFDFQEPLNGLPELKGRSPDRVSLVSALNWRNPGMVFGKDPIGLRMGPDFAARFRGTMRIPETGRHTFFLGADDGATLLVNGTVVAELNGGGGRYQEQSGTVDLPAGVASVEVIYFDNLGNAELVLAHAPPQGVRRVLAPEQFLTPLPDPVSTDAEGRVSVSIPSHIPAVMFSPDATAGTAGRRSRPIPPTRLTTKGEQR